MPMRRRLLAFGLFALWPALASSQEAKLVNCRTLEAAGNFVGPDEVIVDDLVCQKVKPGTDAAKQQPQKPVIGTVVSDAPAENVVDAAKAAEKRVANRREQDRNAIAGAASAFSNAASNASQEQPASSPAAGPVSTASPSTSSAEPVTTSSAPESSPQPVASTARSEPPPQPTPSKHDAKTEAPAEAAQTVVPAPASSSPVDTTGSKAVANEVVSPANSASAHPASIPPVDSAHAAPVATESIPALSAAEVDASPGPTPEPAPVDSARPATSSGFYDANAPKHSANVAPQTNTGFASAEQVNAGLTPGAASIPQSTPPVSNAASESPVTSVPSDAEVQHTSIAASRIDFDAERDRAVKLGDFAKPHEVSPDPNAEHRTSVDPSAEDGFQDRQRPDCTKNVTLAGLNGEKLVLGVPAWAAKWIEKNEKRMPQICFSETPMKSARNYLIVFSTPAGRVSKETADAAVDPAKNASAAGVGAFTTLYGSTWHYSFDRNVGTTILTQDDADEPHGAPGQVLYATAYTEEGVPVAQRWPGQLKKELKSNEKSPKKLKAETESLEHVSSDLLSQMLDDIAKL